MSKGEQKRILKRRKHRTEAEVKAFKHGVDATREIIGPEIWKKAVKRALPIGFVAGLCTGGALMHYFG